jgi:hypothetical protein
VRLQNCIDRNFTKVAVGENQTRANKLCWDEETDRKLFRRGENKATTAMVSVSLPPIRIFLNQVLPSPQTLLENPRDLVNVRYQASNLAHKGAKSIDRRLGSSLCLTLSVIAM